jgi:hypothetical protein
MMNIMKAYLVAAAVLAGGCTKRVNVCYSDADCKDPGYPFCDVNGEYPASGGEKNSCTVVPDNCPVDRCGCTPGAVLACTGDQLTTCAADGKSTTMDTCALGCASDATRCLTFDPSNGLGDALTMAAGEADVVLPVGATIDTDLGTIVGPGGSPIAITTSVVDQPAAAQLRVFSAHSLTVNDARVVGSRPLALVAYEQVTVQGMIDASARGQSAAVGAQELPAMCASMANQTFNCTSGSITRAVTHGGGGGGNAATGGRGGGVGTLGGTPFIGFEPLAGGCRGGGLDDAAGNPLSAGGAGGGAVEIVSLRQVTLSNGGFIHVGGGGGGVTSGGGSGGTVVLEAPQVQITGAASGIAANGGAGGGCNLSGADATANVSPAPGPTCGNYSGGNGATSTVGAADGAYCTSGCLPCDTTAFGGGGGAIGRVRIATKDGSYVMTSNPVMSAQVAAAILTPK